MWPKGGAFLPGPRGPQHPELSPFYISVSHLLTVAKEDAAAQPGELLLPRTLPGSRAAAGWRNPPGTAGRVASRFGAPGQVGGSLRPRQKAGAV